METSAPRRRGERAVISSGINKATPPNGMCLRFWYHMFGAHVNTLNVYQQTPSGNKSLIWTRSGTQGNVWKQGLQTIKSLQPYEVTSQVTPVV
jgi:hypothetical protein